MYKVFLLTLLSIIIPFISSAEDIIKPGETLSLKQCIEISLKMHPDITAAISTVNLNKSKIGQAKADYYPQLDLSSEYKKYSSSFYSKYSSSSESTDHAIDEYSGIFTLKQNIFDFGKTAAKVEEYKFNLDSSLSDLDDVRENIIFNVIEAYYGLLKSVRNRDVAIEAVKQFSHHLELANGFYAVGIKPKIDVTKAEVDLSNAKLNLIKAENALRIAKASLNNALGIPYTPDYNIEDNLSFSEYGITFDDALRKSYENRPDLKSLTAKKMQQNHLLNMRKGGIIQPYQGMQSMAGQVKNSPLIRAGHWVQQFRSLYSVVF